MEVRCDLLTSFGRILAGATVFIFILCIAVLFSPYFLPLFLINYMPIAVFVFACVMLVLGGYIFGHGKGNQVQLASGILWSLAFCSGLVYTVSLLSGFALSFLLGNYLYIFAVSVLILAYGLTKYHVRQRVLGYLSMSPFFVLGFGQIAIFTLHLLELSIGFNNAFIILCVIVATILIPSLWFRGSRASVLFFWFLSSVGIVEIARVTTTISYGLSYFIFPLIGLAFLLLANEWERIIKLRGLSLMILLPFSIAGFFNVSFGLPLAQQTGLFTILFLVLALLFYIGIRSSVFLALILASGLGIIGYRLLILYASYYISWWLAYTLTFPFFAFLMYKCLFESTVISAPPTPTVLPAPPTAKKPKITGIAKTPAGVHVTKPPRRRRPPRRRISQVKVSRWPSIQEYMEAFQNLHIHIFDPELKRGIVETNRSGLPRSISGNFACVFKIRTSNDIYAVRCFYNSKIVDLQKRYRSISHYLKSTNFSFFVRFTYIQNGIRVGGKKYPILKMEWAKGELLNKFIEKNLGNRNLLARAAHEFIDCIIKMQKSEIAHGDLQHGNIKVMVDHRSGSIKFYFVDYDGLYVPDLRIYQAPELGHPNYQHPGRTKKHYNEKLDNFSSLVIYLSMLAIAEDSSLWKRYNDYDRIIFTKKDFENPTQSRVIQELLKSPSEKVRRLTKLLVKALKDDPLSDKILPDYFVAI